jgi:hypothetical protein
MYALGFSMMAPFSFALCDRIHFLSDDVINAAPTARVEHARKRRIRGREDRTTSMPLDAGRGTRPLRISQATV